MRYYQVTDNSGYKSMLSEVELCNYDRFDRGYCTYIQEVYEDESMSDRCCLYRNTLFNYVNLNDEYICMIIAKANNYILQKIPNHLKTYTICLCAVKTNQYQLRDVPIHLINEEICTIATHKKGSLLMYVPEELKTYEVCLNCVKWSKEAIKFVPEKHKTKELCEYVIDIEHIPDDMKTYKQCMTAVRTDGFLIRYVPEHLKSPEMYKAAVRYDGILLLDVPEHLRTEELCMIALKEDEDKYWDGGSEKELNMYNAYEIVEGIPASVMTEKLCMTIARKTGELAYIPEHMKTMKICLIAVMKNHNACDYVPKIFIN